MKQLFAIIVFSIAATAALFCAETTDTAAVHGADLSIRFFERTIYYPGNSPAEPVLVQVSLSNNTPQPLRFKMADDHFYSLDFSALTTRNLPLDHTEVWLRSRSSSRQIYFREVSLEPGESLSFTVDVKDFLDIPTPGMYILQCHFYPELKRLSDESEQRVSSNKLTLEVKPSPSAAAATILPVSPESAQILRPEPMPPDQVLTYILTARQKSHWNQFFLYFDLERMLSRDPARKRRFRAESEDGRLSMIEHYKLELSQATIEKEIATIPVDFRIEKTMYTENEGTVTVIQWFDYRTFREKKRFTYYLSQHDGIWRVYDYTVDNLGTE
ncbi:MAG: hypothetical protein BWY20_01662 [Spirochaetes bacterium ADurb.Bin215]|nr:MAG: hypothetical protein BWY20_01662 [Spirochaetes bacterium ADurb.Bin215]